MAGQIRTGGGCVRVGGTVKNNLKGGGTEKRGGQTKILKRRTSWIKGWVPYKGGAGIPLPTMSIIKGKT